MMEGSILSLCIVANLTMQTWLTFDAAAEFLSGSSGAGGAGGPADWPSWPCSASRTSA